MSVEMAQRLLADLSKNYSRNFSKEGVGKIYPDLVKESDKALEAAFDHFVLNSAFLPSPAQLLAKVQAEGKRIRTEEAKQREKEWADKKEKPEEGGSLFQAARDEHAKAAIMCIKAMQTNKPHAQKLEFFKMMDDRYPGRGWGNAGAELKKDYERERPHWRDISETSPLFQLRFKEEQERVGSQVS